MLIVGITLAVIGIIVFIYGLVNCDDDGGSTFAGVMSGMLLLVGVALICMSLGTPKPTALDVYRGTTTLQITYQDSIPVDSVVVFKNK